MWRSWLAYASGGRVVAGSSPVIPTTFVENQCFTGEFFRFVSAKTLNLPRFMSLLRSKICAQKVFLVIKILKIFGGMIFCFNFVIPLGKTERTKEKNNIKLRAIWLTRKL